MEFSERVLQARKAKGMSQEKLAELIGVSRQAVSKWETGEAKPDVDKLIAICEALELSMDYLCFGKQDELCKQELHFTGNVEQEQNKQGQKKLWKYVGVLCSGIVVGILIMTLVFYVPMNKKNGTNIDYSEFLHSMTVANVTHELKFGNGGKYWTLYLVPSMQIEGLQMQYMIINHAKGNVEYLDAEYRDGLYQADWNLADRFNGTFIAVFTLGELSVQVPLFQVEGSPEFYSTTVYWDE